MSQNNFTYQIKLETQIYLTQLRSEFERECGEHKIKFDLQTQKLRGDMEEYSNRLINELEEQKEQKVIDIIDVNNTKYKELKNYYNDIIASNLSLIKQLK